MSAVEVEIEIAAPAQVIFDVMLDPSHLPDWVTIHRSVEFADTGPVREGYRMDQVLALRGAPFKVKWALSRFQPPHRATWQGRGPAGSRAETDYRLTPGDDPASTRFHYRNEYRAPGGLLGAAASRALVGATSETEARASLARLKALLEQ